MKWNVSEMGISWEMEYEWAGYPTRHHPCLLGLLPEIKHPIILGSPPILGKPPRGEKLGSSTWKMDERGEARMANSSSRKLRLSLVWATKLR